VRHGKRDAPIGVSSVDVGDDDDLAIAAPAPVLPPLEEAKKLVKDVRALLKKDPSYRGRFPFKIGKFAEMTQQLKEFYGDLRSKGVVSESQWSLVRVIMSGVASSAESERMFSGAGLIDSALRNRMSGELLEMSTIVMNFLRGKTTTELREFWTKVSSLLKHPDRIYELELLLHQYHDNKA